MVYQIFKDEIESSSSFKRFKIRPKKPQNCHLKTNTKSLWWIYTVNLLITVSKILLLLYDAISLPIYFLLQRPDRRADEARQIQAQQVDSNTWIRTIEKTKHNNGNKPPDEQQSGFPSFMGATMSEIFTNSIRQNHSKACLGYRAVVTCPMLTQNELGEHILEEKSFRSDYTWYTYGQIGRRVQDIASGLYYYSVYPTSRALFLASTCLEWFCAAQSCFQLAIELVLVPDVNDLKTLELILIDSEAQVLFVTCDQLARLCKLIELISDQLATNETNQSSSLAASSSYHIALKRIFVIDWQFAIDFDEDQFQRLGAVVSRCKRRLEVLSMGQIEEVGAENPIQLLCSSAISEEEFNQSQLYDDTNRTKSSFYKSTSRYFNFDSCSTGCEQFVKRRNISDTNTVVANDKAASEQQQERAYEDNHLKRSSPRRRWRGNSADATRGNKLKEPDRNNAFSWSNVVVDSSKAPRPDDLAIIVYTHGSLGQLKPIVLTHSQMVRSSGRTFLNGTLAGQEVHCTILSLDNVIEFMIEICVFARGGSIGYSGNLQTYFYDGTELFARDNSDLEALEPTFLLVRPYHLERLRNSTQNFLHLQLNPIMSFIFRNVLYDYKKFWASYHFKTPIIDLVFCSKLKRLFGRRIKYILCNGATDCPSTKDYFAFMADLPVIELYGPEEAPVSMMSINCSPGQQERSSRQGERRERRSGCDWLMFQFGINRNVVDTNQNKDDDDCGANRHEFQHLRLLPPRTNTNIHKQNVSRNILIISSILCPTPATRIRLEDWEEFSTADQPYPRGRLVIGGDLVCKGYFKRPLLTDEIFCLDSNRIRWFRTGDIARAFPNGTFEIISAISDMIKMVDGQFISLSQIEHLIRGSQFVDNVCAICGGDRKFVINLVVPNLRRLALKSMGQVNLEMAMSMEPEPDELVDIEFRREVCNDRLLCEFVNEHLSEILARSGLASITNRFLLVPEIWTPESELVTPAFRPKRKAIQKFYASDIQSIVKFEFGVSTSRRLSARRKAAPTTSQTSSSATPPQNHRYHQLSMTKSGGGSLSSVKSI